ncbi:hypothetical protein PROFUN_10951 [Planoprotostelium fungivorum]|uniref:Uncharacterized protein n=1 Tax=Planoprotostelium fungivorum TaxID=1890364 RepID=A0A2P6NBU4_9EUKA|nr:hypothetical protein PROFUN_10951 [Planoprotostelium fungivorum]
MKDDSQDSAVPVDVRNAFTSYGFGDRGRKISLEKALSHPSDHFLIATWDYRRIFRHFAVDQFSTSFPPLTHQAA